VEITDGIGDLSVQDKRRSIQAVEWRSVPGGFREQLNHHHAQHNQAHPQHRRYIQLLPVDEQRRDADHHDAHPGPYRVRHADRHGAHHQRQHPERHAVTDDHQQQRNRGAPAFDGFHGNGGDHFRADGDGQVVVGGIHRAILGVISRTVGASLLAKNVNDNPRFLNARGACEFFASKLAPTVVGILVVCQMG
jgi:hypothetical protein